MAGDTLRLRAVSGLPTALLHGTTVPAGPDTPAGFALHSAVPVVVADLEAEPRFSGAAALRERGVRAGVSAAIRAGERAWGVLSAHTTAPREFAVDEVHFLEGVANVLSAAVVRQDAEEETQRQALHDPLTGLPNRILLQDRLTVALGRLLRDPHHLAVIFVDLDRFKVVNDSLGHQGGDEVLTRLAARIRAVLRPSDTLARIGGDEFVLVCEQLGGVDEALGVARRVLDLLLEPMDIEGQEVVVTASLGVATTIDPGTAAVQLLQEAGAAMYHAKTNGGAALALFDAPMRSRFANRLRVETELRHAVERGEIVCHYQPVVSLASGAIVGAEALVRWAHPTRGLVPPADFIPLAEEVGEITRIGRFVLEEACRATARWATMRDAPLSIAVNLSVRQLQDPELITAVARCLAESGLPPADLCLEITETSVIVDSRSAVSVLAQLKGLGVAIAVDDFGTGYSSVSHLRRFALDQLKIDRSFVTGLAADARDLALVDGVVKLAHSLGLTTSAEGVETAEQLAVLRDLGCDYAQGFLMARPLPPAAFEALWLSGRTW
ncbi:MAG TPA: EAL domain-containing protein [Candidatus Dormibacteraeota bacterium]|nr:EAL domain-containing protein [Candidatus Dormibacteraeota bacterium]